MRAMTIDDLLRILTESAGHDEALDAAGVADTDFEELGYDSLALLETAARIEQELGIELPEDLVTDAGTPRELLELVNSAIPEPA
jgi:act minimal PKS acyl carrier protein